ncbi:hypothetical protein ONA91_31145 [Micromonospora sp. DR5-3]|uniref:hypothetical protein n=1 Tax=unclassified Micromonospora TaxID=2617518 RepID=UPI0011D36777|nr:MULTISPECIES: hypothetical protein [unclassified Micromonospora]MCW3818905.1 hypothetical protein [Micromonospora sp. DR5-3]TYC20930.1 hypothetical protein FXF52_28565 [Micromonospora sp. MP36]
MPTLDGNRLTIEYPQAGTTVVWRFDDAGLWLEPVGYAGCDGEDVLAVHYFATVEDGRPRPALRFDYLIQPGLSGSSALGPVLPTDSRIDVDCWLGHGATADRDRIAQQWALPSHYFAGLSIQGHPNARGGLTEHRSDAFCCGLADLPAADVRLCLSRGLVGPVVDVRSDLWGQARGAGPHLLGPTWHWSVGADYRQAIRGYYRGLVEAGRIAPKRNSAAKNSVAALPQYNTWGAQLVMEQHSDRFDQPALEAIYDRLRNSGMRSACFVIDDKWEREYGHLEHCEQRFPRFDEFLARLRADGLALGLWAAFLRCEQPESLGLDTSHMLHGPDGRPIVLGQAARPYYLFDVSRPQVRAVLAERVRRFIRRYRPDLVKFDFGYELPSLSRGAPADPSWAGERLLRLSLDVIVGTMRAEHPDIVVMYYSLSPLFVDHFDLHSTDDLWRCAGEYHLEVNRRLFFSSLLGEIGVPSYGSGGYDWVAMGEIWFDSIASGSLGSLGSFVGDQRDSDPDPGDIARHNGLAAISRAGNTFSVTPLRPTWLGGSSGARSSSWLRCENNVPMLVALRTHHLDGGRGPASYADVVHTDVQVVVASRTDDGIGSSRRLGVVPFGDGQVTIRHDGPARAAAVTVHRLGGAVVRQRCAVDGGWLRLPLSERLEGAPVEWLDVEFVD